jgi:iron-sulfur cluster assembly protein
MEERVITVTETAARQIQTVLLEHSWNGYGLRFGLQDGGCSGYTYLLDFEEKPDEDDLVHEEHGVKVFIHPLHVPFVQGSVLSYKDELFEAGFHIENPNVKRSCGCGESFDV